ncbi:MAG: alpha-amylase family glycosyl hydrolase, partial [Firmicutes bacterium]|nr:alpha-amylase family glycosyl hydrolase [Bacillota bacterium]
EIYPQSFYDSNGDGIGDFNGIIAKLDYIEESGFNAIWLNPCFLSPFMDAGYDVQDYYRVAPRYGTNEDLYRLFKEAHKRNMRVILDLVPGHTSDKCEWFKESCKPEANEYSDRYIWTKCVWDRPEGYSWVAGNADRDGSYMLNFFLSQPALNYGFNNITHPDWQIPYTDKRAQATFDEMLNVMRFWLDRGSDGFRVDMADSLVKNDEGKKATASLWRRARAMLDKDYPEAMLVSEWCDAPRAINEAGFHCDFILDHRYKLLHYATREIDEQGNNKSYFCKTAHVSAKNMMSKYLEELSLTKDNGYISVISGNHDTPRVSYTLQERELQLFYVFLLTLPGVPFVYYGDEIGMRYLPQPSKEGGYQRTGSRTPMQWDGKAENLGFSSADRADLYLDVDRSSDAPCVSEQIGFELSLLCHIKALNRLRLSCESLQADASLEVLECSDDGVLCYKRGEDVMVAFNPTDGQRVLHMPVGEVLFQVNAFMRRGDYTLLAPQTAIIFKKEPKRPSYKAKKSSVANTLK